MRKRNTERRRVEAAVKYWGKRLGVTKWWTLKHEFTTEPSTEEPGHAAQADTMADWRLREATMTWYLERTVALTDEELDNLVIHEMLHPILDPITPVDKDKVDLVEYVTESLAKMIARVAR